MKAVVAEKKFGPAIIIQRDAPPLRPTYLLVRTIAVALNPADALLFDYGMAEANCLIGCDYAGIVEEVGSEVHRTFKKGDRVCGGMRAGDPYNIHNGTAAEIICVKADIAMHIPENMSWEDASTLGVTQLTTGRCMYQKFGLSWPGKSTTGPGKLFVYGGSSAMGTMVTQFAKLSGFEVIATSSPRNFDLCRSYGADHLFDYSNPRATEQIRELAKDSIKLCVDCISTDETAAFCAKVLSPGGKYSSILLSKCPREDVESFTTIGYSFLGEEWEQFGSINAASFEDFEYSKNFAELSERLLAAGKIKPHPVEMKEGGLDAIPAALQDLREKRVSGKKLVVRVG